MTVKSVKCNVKNKYGSSSAVKSVFDCKRTEEDKREIKKRKKTAFLLN